MKDKILESINSALGASISMKIYKEYFKDALKNKLIKINFKDVEKSIFLSFNDDNVQIINTADKFDVEISGNLSSFLFYSLSKDKELFANKINISGDVESANSLNELFKNTDILRSLMFEMFGQKLSSTIFSILDPLENTIGKSSEKYKESLSEYMKYDMEIIPTKDEINNYLDEVDEIKSRTERLKQKIL